MISFNKLGTYGRLGNQLFQYAFLRTTARRLGVIFFCPEWLGDSIFALDDDRERATGAIGIERSYLQPRHECGFDKGAMKIENDTEILGNFQSERYFHRDVVKKWYVFKEEAVTAVKEKYKNIDFSNSVGIHLRFGDMKNNLKYVMPLRQYYTKALSLSQQSGTVLVFSDEIESAKEYLQGFVQNFLFIEGNKDYEDLYLMSLCHGFVCSVSTLSWWGAWLIDYPDKIIVTPKEWIRPGYPIQSRGLCSKGWISLRNCRFLVDHYHVLNAKQVWGERFGKVGARDFRGNLSSLKNYLRNKMSFRK